MVSTMKLIWPIITAKQKKTSPGVSLIEALIALSIFALLSVVSVTVFFTLTKNQTKVNVSNDTYAEAQNLLKRLTTEIRQTRFIDTDCTSSNQIALAMNDGSTQVYTVNDDSEFVLREGCPVEPGETILSSPNIRIDQLSFRLNPTADTKPPTVTVSIKVSAATSTSGKPQLSASVDLETTIGLRSY